MQNDESNSAAFSRMARRARKGSPSVGLTPADFDEIFMLVMVHVSAFLRLVRLLESSKSETANSRIFVAGKLECIGDC